MADDTTTTERGNRLQVIAAVILGLATVASAWGAYQSTRWGGVMSTAFSEANLQSNDAAKAFQLADSKLNLDQTLFVQWAVASDQGEFETADYIDQNLFSFELGTAFDAWLAAGDAAPATPFEMEEYFLDELSIGSEFETAATATFDKATDANQTGDNYVLVTVILASALFFAGISTVLSHERARIMLIVFAGALFLGATITMLTLPIE